MTEQPHFLKDLEAREILSLDHAKLARSMVEGIKLSSPPFRFALFGPWGSGKTTILRLVRSELEDTAEEDTNTFFQTLWMNAWEYESSSNLFHSLMLLLVSQMPDGMRYSRRGSNVVGKVLEAARWHGRRFITKGEQLEQELLARDNKTDEGASLYDVESVQSDFERFVDMLLVGAGKKRDRCLVVFIDDLDKCLPLHGLALLESIKLFFAGQTKVVFVCSVESEILAQFVRWKYDYPDPQFADSYLEKVFEFSYDVPTISTSQLSRLVDEIFKRSGLADRPISAGQLKMEVAVVKDVLSRPGLTLSPRQIKRTFNRFLWFVCHEPDIDEAAARSDEALNAWLTWLLTTDYWRDLREYVSVYRELAFRELWNRVIGHPLFPHSSDAAKQALTQMRDSRALIEFLRASISQPEDPHLAEAQEEIRDAVLRFSYIDATLRSFGM